MLSYRPVDTAFCGHGLVPPTVFYPLLTNVICLHFYEYAVRFGWLIAPDLYLNSAALGCCRILAYQIKLTSKCC